MAAEAERLSSDLAALLRDPEFVEGRDWRERHLAAGETLFAEGSPGETLYLLEAGAVRVTGGVELDQGRRIQPGVCDLGPGAVFGEVVLFDEGPRSATVMATHESRLIEIDGPALLRFLDAHPERGYRILRGLISVMVGRLRATNRKLLSLLAWGLKAHDIDGHL